jgi:hypothetical protein
MSRLAACVDDRVWQLRALLCILSYLTTISRTSGSKSGSLRQLPALLYTAVLGHRNYHWFRNRAGPNIAVCGSGVPWCILQETVSYHCFRGLVSQRTAIGATAPPVAASSAPLPRIASLGLDSNVDSKDTCDSSGGSPV